MLARSHTHMHTCMRMHAHSTNRLREFPACTYVDDVMNDVVTIIVDERQRASLVRYGQCELVVIHQTHLKHNISMSQSLWMNDSGPVSLDMVSVNWLSSTRHT